MPVVHLHIVHETNPIKYFPALYYLHEHKKIQIVGEHRYSVVKEWFRSAIRERRRLKERTQYAFGDLFFRLQIPFIRNETILLGFAPWDWRILIYQFLCRRNCILYHTSWHDWRSNRTPRQYGVVTPFLRKKWLEFLRHPNVQTIAVHKVIEQELRLVTDCNAIVIPHSVPDVFYQMEKYGKKHMDDPLRLIYVGELSEKKGIKMLLRIVESFSMHKIQLILIGDGQLREECHKAAKAENISYLGTVNDRATLAKIMADQDLLILLSKRTNTWEELFGIVITEALAAGLGVIATNHIGPTIIFKGKEIDNLFEENEEVEIKHLLESLSGDPQALLDFKAKHAYLAQKYRIEVVAEQWLAVINRLQNRLLEEC